MFYENDTEYYYKAHNENFIKIYTGNTREMRMRYTANINRFKEILNLNNGEQETIIQALKPSTLTIKGNMTEINFNEEKIIKMLNEPTNPYIIRLLCNFGEIINTTTKIKKPIPPTRISNRGRKPKNKLKHKRKQQGSGMCFSSQITFEIYNPDQFLTESIQKTTKIDDSYKIEQTPKKKEKKKSLKTIISESNTINVVVENILWEILDRIIDIPDEEKNLRKVNQLIQYHNIKPCKIKLFRNGNFCVPGVRNPDLTDILNPVFYLRDYMRNEFLDTSIDVKYITPVMRNYTSYLTNNRLIHVNELEEKFKIEKQLEFDNQKNITWLNSKFPESITNIILSFADILYPIGLSEIQYNCERYFGLIVKFSRPVPWTVDKKTTLKFLRSGKINFDGGSSIEEIQELYYWLQCFYRKYQHSIIYNNSPTNENSDSTSEFSSIYDDDDPPEKSKQKLKSLASNQLSNGTAEA